MSEQSHHAKTVWMNGKFLTSDKACISIFDRGFLYGDGFFETIRAENGKPLYLREHIERLYYSLICFRMVLNNKPLWADVISELLRRNGLAIEAASVKIIVTRGVDPGAGMPLSSSPTVCISASKYNPPTSKEYEKGWRLHLYKESFSPPIAHHKSLNYLHYLAARQAALDCGCEEAVLLDHRRKVAETSAGSLLARTDRRWWTPKSACQLPGITIRTVCSMLGDTGAEVESRPARPKDLLSAQTVWVLNSLIGVMPVARIGGQPLEEPAGDEAARIRALLFSKGLAGAAAK